MVEPLTIVGAVAASSQLAEQIVRGTVALVELYGKVRDAPETVRKQLVHIEQLAIVVQLVPQNPALQTDIVALVLRACFDVIEGLSDILNKALTSNRDSSLAKVAKALVSVMKEKKVADLFKQLESQKTLLILCIHQIDSKLLQSIHLEVKQTAETLDRMSFNLKDVANDVTILVDAMPAVKNDLTQIQHAIPAMEGKVTTIFNDLPQMAQCLDTIRNVMLPELMQQLQITQQGAGMTPGNQKEPPKCFEVPNRLVRKFFGREDSLRKIDHVLCSPDRKQKVVVLHGMGGQGKTQIALEYCRRKKDAPFECTFWLDASSETSLRLSFESMAEKLQHGTESLHGQDSKIQMALQKLAEWPSEWLLVFDNYDDVDSFGNILDYFPPGAQGAILVTSRHLATRELVEDLSAGFIEIEGLDDASAVSLLLGQSNIARSDPVEIDALEVVHRLGNHALAITQAAAYISKQKIGLQSFLVHYNSRRKRILDTTSRLSQYRKRLNPEDDEKALSVFTTWELSFQQLESRASADRVEPMFMTMLSLFDCNNISENLFRACCVRFLRKVEQLETVKFLISFWNGEQWNDYRFRDTVAAVEELSLVQVVQPSEDEPITMRLHPLVQDWIRLRTDQSTLAEMSCLTAIVIAHYLLSTCVNDHLDMALDTKQHALMHAMAQEINWEEYISSSDVEAAEILWHDFLESELWIGDFATRMGQYALAQNVFQRVADNRKKILTNEDPYTLKALDGLASTYAGQGRRIEAEALYLQVVETSKRVLGDENPNTLTSMHNLAFIYLQQERLREAEALYAQLTESSKRVLGDEHQDTLSRMHNLASTYWHQGRWAEAEALEMQVLETSKRVLGNEHPNTLYSINSLASTYSSQERWAEAETLYLQVIEISKRVLGSEDLSTLSSMHNLATTYWRQGHRTEAQQLLERATEGLKRVLGSEHPGLLTLMQNLAFMREQAQ